MLPKQIVAAILREISPRIIGQPHRGFRCDCGEIHYGPGVAAEIRPAADRHLDPETWFLWSVRIRCEDGRFFDVLPTEFIPAEELDDIFRRHFAAN